MADENKAEEAPKGTAFVHPTTGRIVTVYGDDAVERYEGRGFSKATAKDKKEAGQ